MFRIAKQIGEVIFGIAFWGVLFYCVWLLISLIAYVTSWWFIAGCAVIAVPVLLVWLSFVVQLGRNWG